MKLYEAKAQKKYKVIGVQLQPEIMNRVLNLGIFVGAIVYVVKSATKSSPILINCHGLNVAFGGGISKNIEVFENE